MSDKKESPYSSFLRNEGQQGDDSRVHPSAELLDADRGDTDLTAEDSSNLEDKKKFIIVGIVLVAAIAAVMVFVFLLFSKMNTEEVVVEAEPNAALFREEYQEISGIQDKINKEAMKREATEELARERLAKIAMETAERNRRAAEAAEAARVAEEARLAAMSKSEAGAPEKPSLGLPPPPQAAPMTIAESATKKPEELTPLQQATLRKASSGVMGYQSNSAVASGGLGNDEESPAMLGNMLRTERHRDGTAYVRASREFLLLRGTNIACTMLPRMITNYPSQPTCVVNRDVYSPDGVVLVDRGSQVIGEQRTAMRAGVSKVFISWANIETPEGVSIDIDSMAADQLGGSGVDAWIDNHYAERFGGAILLSLLDDVFETIAAQATDNDQNVSYESSTDNANSMAQIVLENSINIEPTGYIMPARQIMIIVARDIDFTNVYTVN